MEQFKKKIVLFVQLKKKSTINLKFHDYVNYSSTFKKN